MTDHPRTPHRAFLLLMGLSLLIMAPMVIYPCGRDQGMFGYTGRMVLHGAVPFRDFWDPKPPAIYYTYALGELLFGYSMIAVRVLDILWQLAVAAVLFHITRRLSKNNLQAVVAGLLYVVSYASRGWWNTAQPDDFLNLPAALGILFFMMALERQRIAWLSVMIGMLAGAAFYFRYPMGALLAVFMCVILVVQGMNRRTVGAIVAMGGGFVLLAGGYALYLYLAGAWGKFFYTEFIWTRGYTGLGGTPRTFAGVVHLVDILHSHFSVVGLIFLALPTYLWAIKRDARDIRVQLIALWVLVALVNLYLENKFYIYHFAPLLAPLAIGASGVVSVPFETRRRLGLRTSCGLFVLCVVLASLAVVNTRYGIYCLQTYRDSVDALAGKLLGGKGLDDYYMNVRFTSDDFSLPADRVVARYLDEHTRPDETVFIWGCETLVYYLAQRRAVSPFIHNFPFRCPWTPDRFGVELLSALSREKPDYFLVVRNDPTWWATGTHEDSLGALRRYPQIEMFLVENYSFETSIEDFLIYKRTGAPREGRAAGFPTSRR
ncbi:MAG: glycosyltransferase family 39 protein [Candidatus Aureabacteria bacterium]|nr:glycosyltransferase family 39 protein [Candidatus Auribacterota bacterium]